MGSQDALQDRSAVIGVGATQQGVHPGVDQYVLGVRAFSEALEEAGIDKSEIDGVLGAELYGTSGIDAARFARLVGLNPRVTGSLDYGTGGFTTQYAAMLIATGVCDVVACVFARNPAGANQGFCGPTAYDPNYGLFNAAAIRAMGWARHMAKYGTSERALAEVAVAQRNYARTNPLAARTEPLTLDDYYAEDYLAWPFRPLDISRVTAGACAIIMTSSGRAKDYRKPPVYMHAVGRRQATRRLDNDEHFLLHQQFDVARQLYEAAGFGPEDIDVLGVSDATTAAIPQTLENFGFCEVGDSEDFLVDGAMQLDGAIPTNTDGGQLSGGYLVGWLHQVELVRQLRGEAYNQVEGAKVGQYCTTGRYLEDYLATIWVAAEAVS